MTSLSSRIIPFTVTPPGAVSAEAQLRHAMEFEQSADHSTLMEGTMTMTNANARALQSTNAYILTNFDESEMVLDAQSAFMGAALGVEHPFTASLVKSMSFYRRIRQQLHMVMTCKLNLRLAVATFAYHFHTKAYCWFLEQWQISSVTFEPPLVFIKPLQKFNRSHNLAWLPGTPALLTSLFC